MHARLVNGRTGDPAVYVETLFEKHAVLFDLGDISALSPRKVQRLSHVFVSHTHLDHFIGFDTLLRLNVGRDKTLHLHGPAGFIDHVHHKLQAYRWNLADRYACDLIFVVTELGVAGKTATARFRLKTAFAEEMIARREIEDGVLFRAPTFRVSTAVLDHRTACLAFAIEEEAHVNVWKSRLTERNLPVGPWLRELKHAVMDGRPDDHAIAVASPRGEFRREVRLGDLRDLVTVTPGQKIAYVTDLSDTPANRAAVIGLVQGADLLFIEAAFAAADAAIAADRAHLTTAAAGEIARAAGVRRVEPFHFSPRYAGEDERMMREVTASFAPDAAAAAR
jgi:ribonuclease Z